MVYPKPRQALVVRLGEPMRVVTNAGSALQDTVHRQRDLSSTSASSISETPAQEIIASDQKRLVVDAFARYRIVNPLQFYQAVGIRSRAPIRSLPTLLNSALRRVLGEATLPHPGA